MGENAKERKSLWDAEEESPNSPKYEEWGPPKADNLWQSKSRSGWSSGDNVTGTEDLRKDNYHDKSMSPAFERQSNSHSPDNGRAQSRRYVGRARGRSRGRGERRSRSRSRGRDKFRTRSRSRSRDKGSMRVQNRSRSRGRDKFRTRSRSRSRDKGSMRVQNRSRSPHNSKRDPYASADRRTGLHMYSKVCRNFAVGNCRRGSQCWFFHPDAAIHRDGGNLEDNLSERLGSRPERGHISRYNDSEGLGYQSRDKLPYLHNLEDELHRNQSRGRITCRNFVKGDCRWGASCRFSHDSPSGDNYEKGTQSESFNYVQGNQATRTGKLLCEYFAAGKCYKDNCKFSHDATSRNHEIRPSNDNSGHRFDGTNIWLDGPKWDNETRPSELVKASGWDESVVRTDTSIIVLTDGTNEKPDHHFENKNKAWEIEPQFINSDTERGVSPHRGSASHLNALNITESSVTQSFANAQGLHLISQASDLNLESASTHVLGHSSNQGASEIVLSTTTTQPYGSAESFVQPHGLTKENIARTLGSNVVNEFMNDRDGVHHVHLPGQSFSGTGFGMSSEHSAVLNETHQEENVFLPVPSTGHNKIEALGTPEMLDSKVPQYLTVSGEQVHQMETSPASMTKKVEEGQRETQLQSVLNPCDSSGMLPSNPISALVHALYGQIIPEMRVPDNYHPPDGLELNTSGNIKLPPDNSFYLYGDSNKVSMDQMNQTSTVDPELGNNDQIDEVKKQKNELVDVDEKDKLALEESKNVEENDHPGAMNLHGKVEEGSGNNNEKVMRLFKNALIEFVKEILKPIWKEGKMSREVHKTIVKKVVDKVIGSIQGEQVAKTQEDIEEYLSRSKPKITKLVQAYVEWFMKNEV